MRICRELWLVPPSCNWGSLFLLRIGEEHHGSLYWSAWGVGIYCTKLFVPISSSLLCNMCLSHQFVSHLSLSYPNASHDFASTFGGKSSPHIYIITPLHIGGPGRSSPSECLSTIIIFNIDLFSDIPMCSLATRHFNKFLNFTFFFTSLLFHVYNSFILS